MTLSLRKGIENPIPLALIKGDYEFDGQVVYLNQEEDLDRKTDGSEFQLEDGKFIPIPNPHNDSNVYFLVGPRGSGKTVLSTNIATMYNVMHPENRIYIFTENGASPQNAELYRRLKNVILVPLDKSIVTNPIKLVEIRDALCIFDDFATADKVEIETEVETPSGKKKKKKSKVSLTSAIDELRDKVIQNGRHHHIDVIICEHMLFSYKRTRQTLEELNYLVFYKDTGISHVQRYLKNFLGLDKKQIQDILKRKSRWTLVCKNSPRYVLTENECFLIKDTVDPTDHKPKSILKKTEHEYEPEEEEGSEEYVDERSSFHNSPESGFSARW